MPLLKTDDHSIHYFETGHGAPPMVFVHGTGGDLRDFEAQLGYFQQERRCVAIDLPGHGENDTPTRDYTIPSFANDVHGVCTQLGLKNPVLVGHSMGGTIVLELASHEPQLPVAVILLDAPVLLSAPAVEGYREAITAMDGPNYDSLLAAQVHSTLLLESPASSVDRILRGHQAVPRHVMLSVLRNGIDYIDSQTEAAVAGCQVPMLYIGAGPAAPGAQLPGPSIANHVDFGLFHDLALDLTVGQSVGTGHHHHVQAPTQISAMIEAFLEVKGL